jgi:hypothetical protein
MEVDELELDELDEEVPVPVSASSFISPLF